MSKMIDRYEYALQKEDYAGIQQIISELNAIAPSKKEAYRDLYKRIGDDLFEHSVDLTNYDLASFDLSISDSKNKFAEEKLKKPVARPFKDNLHDLLVSFCKNSKDILPSLKSHFIYELQNDTQSQAELLILTSENCFNHPLIIKLKHANKDLNPVTKKLADFIEECKVDHSLLSKRYLCLVVIVSHIVYDDKEKKDLEELFNSFKNSWTVTLKDCMKVEKDDDYTHEKIDSNHLDEVHNVYGKVFNNRDVTFDEEKIIKKFFSDTSTVLDYKLLKGGFSGAKVAEIQPNRNIGRTARFVVKYGKKDALRKIKKEHKAFKRYLFDYSIPGYAASYEETPSHEAIQYSYASSDNRTSSYQFADLIGKFLAERPLPFQLPDVITDLVKCEPFNYWGSHLEEIKEEVSQLYGDYINDEVILKKISAIEGKTAAEIEISDLWRNYQEIKTYSLRCNRKVCHGDLHTENLFKDSQGVFLIDFGYTKEAHAVLDHTTLEASIKFKHVPFYIKTSELTKYDEQMFTIGSFDDGFSLDFIHRPYLKELYSLILLIRQDAKKYLVDNSNPLEYFISLFIITMRQIQYGDLNQKYAMLSAKSLAEYIVTRIK